MEKIKAGYQLQVTTWENDGDDYKTTITSGLSKEDVVFLVELSEHFSKRGKLGNNWVKNEQLRSVIENALENNPSISQKMSDKWKSVMLEFDEDSCYARDLLRELLLEFPSGEGYDQDFCRYVDSIEVYFFPNDINNVTKEFLKE